MGSNLSEMRIGCFAYPFKVTLLGPIIEDTRISIAVANKLGEGHKELYR